MVSNVHEALVDMFRHTLTPLVIARGIAVPPDVRDRISDCHDLDQLRVRVRRAATVNAADALFS
jgi:hypothetical protein